MFSRLFLSMLPIATSMISAIAETIESVIQKTLGLHSK